MVILHGWLLKTAMRAGTRTLTSPISTKSRNLHREQREGDLDIPTHTSQLYQCAIAGYKVHLNNPNFLIATAADHFPHAFTRNSSPKSSPQNSQNDSPLFLLSEQDQTFTRYHVRIHDICRNRVTVSIPKQSLINYIHSETDQSCFSHKRKQSSNSSARKNEAAHYFRSPHRCLYLNGNTCRVTSTVPLPQR